MGPHQPAKEADMCDFHDVVNYVMSGLIILAVTAVPAALLQRYFGSKL